MTRAAIALVLASQLALGAEPVVDGGLVAIAVESATLRPLDSPTAPVEVGPGVYLPEALAVSTAAKVAAYEAAKSAQVPTVSSPVVWLVVGALVLGVGGGVAIGWAAASAARPTAAQ
jgi:hypothetical protein